MLLFPFRLKRSQVSLFHPLKDRGQVLIEGIFLLIVFFSFLFSVIWLEGAVKEQIRLESLHISKQKRKKRRNKRKEFSLKRILKESF